MPFFNPPRAPVPAGFPLEPFDRNGKRISNGALVRIDEIPDWLTHDLPEEDVVRLRQRENTVMHVVEIDAYGFIWFGEEGESESGHRFCLKPSEVSIAEDAHE